jgi:hypothetical protein
MDVFGALTFKLKLGEESRVDLKSVYGRLRKG